MKFMALRTFGFSILALLPFIGILSQTKAGDYITAKYDTVSVNLVSKNEPSDTVVVLLNSILSFQKKQSSKLDTGLSRQINYMQSQNILASNFISMSNEISGLKQQLKVKEALPVQIIKDAEKGKIQSALNKILVVVVFGFFIIIALFVALFVYIYKPKLNTISPNDTK